VVRPSRITVVFLCLILFALGLVAQAAKVQIIEGKQWALRARTQHFRGATLPAPRGAIFDGTGNVLVESRQLVQLEIAPAEVRDRSVLSRQLRAAGVDARTARSATDTRRKYVVLPGLYAPSDVAALTSTRGVHARPVMDRAYAGTGGIRRIVGRIAPDGSGLDGIELALDSILRGDSVRALVAKDSRGRTVDSPDERQSVPRPGADVTLTINRVLQEICERALARAADSLGADGGDIVVMNPFTGDILAMATRRANRSATANTAVTEPFEPGSTLKPFVAAALIERGLAQPDEIVDTYNGQLEIDGRVITDLHKAPRMSLRDVIRYSSNIGIVQFAQRLSPREKYETLRDLGFGMATSVPLPAESDGMLRDPKHWSRTSAASLAMGYEISVTPLQLVAAYSALANGGELMQPQIVKQIRTSSGDVIYRSHPRAIRRVMSEPVASAVREMLVAVVDSGTAMRADLATYLLGGKSGTARRVVEGRGYVPGSYTASFVGLFPARRPQYVVLVKLDSPRRAIFGGEIAAPVTKVVLLAALAARDAALNKGELANAERVLPGVDSSGSSPISASTAPPMAVAETTPVDAPAGSVTFSLPYAGKAVPSDNRLRPVPDVSMIPLRDAVRALHQAGFRIRLATQGHGTIPAAGTLLAPGSVVRLAR
jgi:cell division protein FtsI (penicillin-binding protein 3)